VRSKTAGLDAADGKMVCVGVEDEGWNCEEVEGVCDWEVDCEAEGEGRLGKLKVEELERVGEGWTGPSCARRALNAASRSGSDASRFMAGGLLVFAIGAIM
jgi:hypothetical protein